MTGTVAGHDPDAVLAFWFGKTDLSSECERREIWFKSTPKFDAEIRERFGGAHKDALAGKLDGWMAGPSTCMALVILLDQFPRNMFRDNAEMYASDAKALAVAKHALEKGYDEKLDIGARTFFYLPLEHSEDLDDQERCVKLAKATGNANFHEYAVAHRDIVARFGRFPHRNAILGRESTPEELRFLKTPGSSF